MVPAIARILRGGLWLSEGAKTRAFLRVGFSSRITSAFAHEWQEPLALVSFTGVLLRGRARCLYRLAQNGEVETGILTVGKS